MPAEHVATVAFDGGVLTVLRSRAGVTITDAGGGHTVRVDQARELCELLDRALSDYQTAPRGLIGSVATADGRSLHVKHTGHHVSIDELPDAHSGWTLRMVDQVEALRDALDRATQGSQAPVH